LLRPLLVMEGDAGGDEVCGASNSDGFESDWMATQRKEHTIVPHIFHVYHEWPKMIATANGIAE